MATFLDIFRIIVAINLGTGFIAGCGIFDVDYVQPDNENLMYNLSDVSESSESSTTTGGALDYYTTIVSWLFAGLNFLKDFAFGSVLVYFWLTGTLHAPELLAALLQTIVAVSWFIFLAQILTRDSWPGKA